MLKVSINKLITFYVALFSRYYENDLQDAGYWVFTYTYIDWFHFFSSFLTASERLIILTNNDQELRDYAILLYHCGYYEECLQNLMLYQSSKVSCQFGMDF